MPRNKSSMQKMIARQRAEIAHLKKIGAAKAEEFRALQEMADSWLKQFEVLQADFARVCGLNDELRRQLHRNTSSLDLYIEHHDPRPRPVGPTDKGSR